MSESAEFTRDQVVAGPVPVRHRPGPRAFGREALRRGVGRTVARFFESLRALPGAGLWHRTLHRGLELAHVDVELTRGHADLDGFEIAWVSDVHAGLFCDPADLTRLGEELALLAPDVVCLGGDMVATRPREIGSFDGFLAALDPPHGVYAILGNHECVYLEREIGPWLDYLAERGVQVLINEGLRIERGEATLWLGGVDDFSEGAPDAALALEGRGEDEPTVLFSHDPDYFEVVRAAHRIDLQLSGHTHGGQVRLFGWAPVTHSRHGYCQGLFRRGEAQLYVGRGFGVSFAPIRLGSRPEVPVIRLRRR